eukprot:TRINITY_DN11525_c0_g1_i1.p2 TRINITY_DN11525_c0_g1~~TRINITY_DN11525_c0_g1_i1.p2  ORF type:complete len:298 (+),score=133.96 TRINITY_DN11525_c0_g1_i1:22-894(+)
MAQEALDLAKVLAFVEALAREAGEVVRETFYSREEVSVEFKDKATEEDDSSSVPTTTTVDLVTKTDKAVEVLIKSKLAEHSPSYLFLGEEEASSGDGYHLTDAPTWVVDPIDGTTNFVHKVPFLAISISLCINKWPVLGVVFNPITNELFRAAKGLGSFLNDQPIRVGKAKVLGQAVIGTNFGYNRSQEGMQFMINNVSSVLATKVRAIRMNGAAALEVCYSAAGRSNAFYEFGIHVWDIAAGVCIVEEAGGKVISPSGQPLDLMTRRVLCGSPEIVDQLTHIINDACPY